MKLLKILTLTVTVIIAQPVLAANYIDSDYKAYQAKRNQVLSKLKNCNSKQYKTVADVNSCRTKIIDEANQKYPARGTDAYSEKHYAKLTKEQANNKIIELKKIYDTAKVSTISRKPGELLKKDVTIEAAWIQENILGRKRTTDVNVFAIPCKGQEGKRIQQLCVAGSDKVIDVD